MGTSYPLLRHYRPDGILSWNVGDPVSASAFLGAAWALARRLPRGRHVLNLCEDRFRFIVGFAASLMSGQVNLLPPSRVPSALRVLQAEYGDAYCLTDSDEVLVGGDVVHVNDLALHGDASGEVPEIAGEQVAAIVFTSGTTGRSNAHPKTWESLVRGAHALGGQLELRAGSSVLGTVPAQHMFGLETTVLLPLQWGMSVHPGRPLLPGDIVAARNEIDCGCWLMTTPLHLRTCLATGIDLPRLEGVISSTMPLTPELARAAEERWETPVLEIYGCTEAGMVALRRTASNASWRLCRGLHLRQAEDGVWVEGGHVTEPVQLVDRITRHDAQHFTLHGRSAGMVKVGGKRISLDALNAELARIPGIRDGVFFLPDPPHTGGTNRLTAFVVAPGMTKAAIVAALRQRIDPAFLPRPLYLVAELPRAATGKLPRSTLHELATRLARTGERRGHEPE